MDGKIAITPDFSGDDRSTRIATLHHTDGSTEDITESEARRRRRLAACEGDVCPNDQKVFSSMAEMKAHVALAMDEDPVLRRRLSTGSTDAMFAVYAFFGGVAEGSISADTIARADSVPDAEDSVIVRDHHHHQRRRRRCRRRRYHHQLHQRQLHHTTAPLIAPPLLGPSSYSDRL